MLSDLRIALRGLLRAPAFAIAAVLCIALGVGANSAVFAVVDGVLRRPLPYPEPDRLVAVWERQLDGTSERNVVAVYNLLDWRARTTAFSGLAAMTDRRIVLADKGESEELPGQYVTTNLFGVLGVQPALGRAFTERDADESAEQVVVVSDALWRRRLGADPGAVGRTVTLNGNPVRVVGVMPPAFRTPNPDAELWRPAFPDNAEYRKRSGRFLTVVGRLKPGTTVDRARTELAAVARRLETEQPESNSGWGVTVLPLHEQIVGDLRRPLALLGGAVALVLLIACANVGNLALTRAAAREQELAVRLAMGAGRWRVWRQLLVESVVVALAGGLVGLAGAAVAVRALVRAAADLPRADDVGIGLPVIAVGLLLALAAGVCIGLVPALAAPARALAPTLRQGGRGATGGGRQGVRSTLVGAQVALALVLLVGAGLLLKSFVRLTAQSPGFAAEEVLTAQVTPLQARYPTDAARMALLDQVVARARALPGVRAAGVVNYLPFDSRSADGFVIAGRPAPAPGEEPGADVTVVAGDYFRAMGIPLRRGEVFSGREAPTGERLVVVNEALARKHFPNENPIGRVITLTWDGMGPSRIIGVVGDVRATGLDSLPNPTTYWPMAQFPWPGRVALTVRVAPGAAGVEPALRRAVAQLDPTLPLADVRPLAVYVAESVARRRLLMGLVLAFGASALALAVVGIYGVVAYAAAQRTRELGLRVAIGARPSDVVRLVIRRGLRPIYVGAAAGLAGAVALNRVITASLYDVVPTDPLVLTGVLAVLLVAAVVASWLPARRAARVDPAITLRGE